MSIIFLLSFIFHISYDDGRIDEWVSIRYFVCLPNKSRKRQQMIFRAIKTAARTDPPTQSTTLHLEGDFSEKTLKDINIFIKPT
jgi:hypothetical protein